MDSHRTTAEMTPDWLGVLSILISAVALALRLNQTRNRGRSTVDEELPLEFEGGT